MAGGARRDFRKFVVARAIYSNFAWKPTDDDEATRTST